MILWQSLSVQFDWETRTCCSPTSSQPFHFSEKPWLPVNLLYNIPGSGWAAEATACTEAPSGRQQWGSYWLVTGGAITATSLQSGIDTMSKLRRLDSPPDIWILFRNYVCTLSLKQIMWQKSRIKHFGEFVLWKEKCEGDPEISSSWIQFRYQKFWCGVWRVCGRWNGHFESHSTLDIYIMDRVQ